MSNNSFSLETLQWILTQSNEGFYLLEGNSVSQRQALSIYDETRVAVFDYSFNGKRSYYFADIRDFLRGQPDCRCCVLLNFQLALSEDADLRRLNFSRDMLTATGKTFVFGVTREAHERLLRYALDFSSFIKLTLSLDEQTDNQIPELVTEDAIKPTDRSCGVDVEVDFSLPREKLLSLAVSLSNQAEDAKQECRFADAVTLYKKALDIRVKELGTGHPITAEIYNDLGAVYHKMGDYTQALKYYQKSLAIDKISSTEHPDTAIDYNNLGSIYYDMGDYPRALEFHQRALAIDEKLFGTEHPDTAVDYSNLGEVYRAMGDYSQALEYHQKALAIDEKSFGMEHLGTAIDYSNLGLVYLDIGDYPRSLKYQELALSIRQKLFGAEHVDTATGYNNLGAVYYEMGDYPRALNYYQKALTIVESILGLEHPSTAGSYNNLGSVYRAMQDYPRSLECYQKALTIYERIHGSENPDTATCYNNLGMVYADMGDYPCALEYYKKALNVRKRILGADHPYTERSRKGLEVIEKRLKQQGN